MARPTWGTGFMPGLRLGYMGSCNRRLDGLVSGLVVPLDISNGSILTMVMVKRFSRDLATPIFPEGTYAVLQRCPLPGCGPVEVSTINTYVQGTVFQSFPSNRIQPGHVFFRTTYRLVEYSILFCLGLVSTDILCNGPTRLGSC
jgi:hypothetical protein